jgi:hypothetical protein
LWAALRICAGSQAGKSESKYNYNKINFLKIIYGENCRGKPFPSKKKYRGYSDVGK